MIAFIENMIREAPMRTAGKASRNICVACFLKMYQSELNPLSNMSGGKNSNRIPLGSILDTAVMDYPRIPILGEK